MEPQKIEISYKTIVFTVVFLILLGILYQVREILFLLFVSSIFAMCLEPSVKKFESFHLPRIFSVLLIYLFLGAFLGIAVAGVIPPFVDQTTVLVGRFPDLLRQINIVGLDKEFLNGQISQLGSIPSRLFEFVMGIFANAASVLALAITSLYLLMERPRLEGYLSRYFDEKTKKEITTILRKIEERLGSWVRGQLTLMVAVGLLSYFGFRLLRLDFALPLAILAGLLEIIPNFGPTIAAIPATLAGLAISPLYGLATMAWSVLVQQIENNLLVPVVMKKVTGLNPLLVIISLGVGFKLAGMAGAVLAIPVILLLEVIYFELVARK